MSARTCKGTQIAEIHTGEQATARVLSVRAAGPVEQGAGHVITGTFQTWNADVRELWMEGLEAPVRVTGGHRFYSESRGWVEAHCLLMGETVRTREGSGARVLGLERLPGVHAVFNLEIEGLHQYHVSPLGLLAHNNNKCESTNTSAQNTKGANEAAEAGGQITPEKGIVNRGGRFADLDAKKLDGEVGHHVPQNAFNETQGLSRADGPAIGMTKEDHAKTRTFAGRGKKTMREDSNLNARQRLAKDILDIRSNFGKKYNQGALEAINYSKTLKEFRKKRK